MRIQQILFWLSLAFSATVRAQSSSDSCTPAPTLIYFGNGILNTHSDAVHGMDALQLKLEEKYGTSGNPPGVNFCLAYDSEYQLVMGGLINLPLQLLDAAEQDGIALASQAVSWITNLGTALPTLQDVALGAIQSANAVDLATRPDLQAQVAHYDADLSAGRNVIVVAHSQGNLYVNEAYADISPDPSQFHVISVASPADYVAGGGPWTTLANDIITLVPGALQPDEINTNTPGVCEPPPNLSAEIACHDFVKSYLAGNNSAPRILDEIVSEIPITVSDTFGPGNSYNLYTSSVIGAGCNSFCVPPSPPLQQSLAAGFIPNETVQLNTVQLAVFYSGGPNELTVYIASGETEPEQPLETFTFTNVAGGQQFPPVVLTAASTLHPRLTSGNRYWVVVTTQDLVDSTFGWQFSSPNVFGTVAFKFANGPWEVQMESLEAFAVTGIP